MRYDQQWQARAVREDGAGEWFPAEVPGNVLHDYGRMMGWGDISVGENVTKFRETEGYVWEYRTALDYALLPGEHAVLVLEGVDYRFDVLIGGELRLSHEGMFSRTEIKLTDCISSEVIVRIHPHPKRETAQFEDRQQADQCVKPPVCYEWDWHPRMLVSGIWQDAYVETRHDDYIRRCEPWITAASNSLITYPLKPKAAYYTVQSSLRPVLASARIKRFDWRAGDRLQAELWLLNDSPAPAQKTVSVSIRLGGAEYPLLTWESGPVPPNTNRIGPTVNWVLPDADAEEFTLRPEAGDASSEYRLCYRRDEALAASRQMNV